MTTAHRATWKAARGGLQEEGSFRLHVPSAAVSSKDAPTEPDLKRRAPSQKKEASRQALRASLESGELAASGPHRKKARFELESIPELELLDELPAEFQTPAIENTKDLDRDAKLDGDEESESEKRRDVSVGPGAGGGEHVGSGGGARNVEEDDDSEDENEDSDDDEAELLAELERIRKEREFERARKQSEEQERHEREQTAKAASGNPLMSNLNMFNDEVSDTASMGTGSVPAFAVKRRWDDDVIFRNQAKGERKETPRFINDTIRNDFHRRFMKRYMR
ncbi:unnamed protein product [Chondrus crispus]|uniref:Cwf15/Cwc15 cell cycle control protein n=1 Tax=Chondrus crispus TaxID=2769 RepID=R7QCN3_CHOCR|nr:unnamed protein product [Chondrus crispus]CDF35220.1 unnamed protein product [Chondrus crispus]|eukprot:XP_005715039.1 unnamed protein product [Chondrus crispus]